MGNLPASTSKADESSPPPTTDSATQDPSPAEAENPVPKSFSYEKGTCALEWWEPLRLLKQGSIADIHLVRRRPKRIHVRYKHKRDIMKFAKKRATVAEDDDSKGDQRELYVLKSIMKDHVGEERFLEEMRREVFTMSRLNHPNIVKLYEAYERRRHIYLVMEYCSGGDLTERSFTENQVAVAIREILMAVAYMHSKGVVHRDLKLENIMMDAHGEIKIIDFGLATKYLSDEYKVMTDRVGTLYSMAPQVLQGVYTSQCDLWSIGVIAYVMLSGHQPFWGPPAPMPWSKRRKIMVDRIMRCQYMRMDQGPSWEKISKPAKDFCTSLLQLDPDDRPTADEALEAPWICEQGYPEKGSLFDKDSNYLWRLGLRQRASELLVGLPQADILHLRAACEAKDSVGEGWIRLGVFRKMLEEEANLVPDKIASVMDGDAEIEQSATIEYMDFFAQVLRDRERSRMENLANALDDLDVEGTRMIKRSDLEAALTGNYPLSSREVLLDGVDIDSDGRVSTVQVLELAGKMHASHHRNSIRSGGVEKSDTHVELADYTNTVIPGGKMDSNVVPKFVYSPERRSIHRVQS